MPYSEWWGPTVIVVASEVLQGMHPPYPGVRAADLFQSKGVDTQPVTQFWHDHVEEESYRLKFEIQVLAIIIHSLRHILA